MSSFSSFFSSLVLRKFDRKSLIVHIHVRDWFRSHPFENHLLGVTWELKLLHNPLPGVIAGRPLEFTSIDLGAGILFTAGVKDLVATCVTALLSASTGLALGAALGVGPTTGLGIAVTGLEGGVGLGIILEYGDAAGFFVGVLVTAPPGVPVKNPDLLSLPNITLLRLVEY